MAVTSDRSVPDSIGSNFPYRPLQPLHHGDGSMAHVYLSQASVENQKQLVVVKLEIIGNINRDLSQQAILNEAEILQQLNHPGVIRLYPIEEHSRTVSQLVYRKASGLTGQPQFLVVEHLPGGSLNQLLEEGKPQLSLAHAVEIALQMARALTHVHERGYVHMDLKPQHLYFRRPSTENDIGEAVLIDFGIARRIGETIREDQPQNQVSPYMAPERLRAQRDHLPYNASPPADLFALGIMLYKMINGFTPFRISDAQSVLDEIEKPRTSPHFLKPQGDTRITQGIDLLDRLLIGLLNSQPDKRPTAKSTATSLREIAYWFGNYVPEQVEVTIGRTKQQRSFWGHFLRFLLGLLALLFALGIGALAGEHPRIRPERDRALQTVVPWLSGLNNNPPSNFVIPLPDWSSIKTYFQTVTPTVTPSATPTNTMTSTVTPTPTATSMPSFTPTPTRTPTVTHTPTLTPMPTSTFAPAPASTGTRTP